MGLSPSRFATSSTSRLSLASEVFDLKPTSRRPKLFVKSGDDNHPRTSGWAHHAGSRVPGSALPQRIHRQAGNRTRSVDVHAFPIREVPSTHRTDATSASRVASTTRCNRLGFAHVRLGPPTNSGTDSSQPAMVCRPALDYAESSPGLPDVRLAERRRNIFGTPFLKLTP